MANAFSDRRTIEDNPTEIHKKAHQRADTDVSAGAAHHTIGNGPYQAASGKKLKQLTAEVASLKTRVTTLEARLAAAGIP